MTSAATMPMSSTPSPGLNRAIAWSFGVHLAAAIFFIFVPREWWQDAKEARTVMVISIGGSQGPPTGGFTSVGARPVEQVVPEPKRPEPILPSTSSKPQPAAATVAPTKPQPKPPDSTAPPDTIARPQATGREITQGTSKVETGATGQGTGLAQGGQSGDSLAALVPPDFCCLEYINIMKTRIDEVWQPNQTMRGTTVLRFVVLRDGTVQPPEVEKRSGIGMLDREAQSAILRVGKLPRLPDAHIPDTLTVLLTFVNGRPR
jgi:TonB family protein